MARFRDGFGEIRAHLDALHAPGGPYRVVCAKSGETPAPLSGYRFDDRQTAAEATDVAATYRAYLRLYDPTVPFADLIVCEDVDPEPETSRRPATVNRE
ncbi:DUF7552 domain-containing protein [Haloarchaeobius amylolyticus]|uniref:DUF7552 domain-containing protein n=1 Tax=Haloarchaeobius amylolyticus TaxID=1198296 RepID=UPI0022709708|nr:hypothetical protein [Haloarchaeobius amylolyticus]